MLNFPYRTFEEDPLITFAGKGLSIPPGTATEEWQSGKFASIWVSGDIPLLALALLTGAMLEQIVGIPAGAEIPVPVEVRF